MLIISWLFNFPLMTDVSVWPVRWSSVCVHSVTAAWAVERGDPDAGNRHWSTVMNQGLFWVSRGVVGGGGVGWGGRAEGRRVAW